MKALPHIPRASQFGTILDRALCDVDRRSSPCDSRDYDRRWRIANARGFVGTSHSSQSEVLDAEVIGFDGSATLLAPLGPMEGVSQGDTVRLFRTIRTVPAGEELIGRYSMPPALRWTITDRWLLQSVSMRCGPHPRS